ncbi:hypothetical protein BV22DRAFT_1051237 [Leucogyrophana mollusca]|uniref:Uncharacterized protein n=1 Tax=Leucogyrophana mollusca TaxID=85980 RepID=A0ACB8B2T5_9AGAM|nr:hypothetical protein BV22DRAFT_1051237 [Leucogyrophana mollusca]
MSSIAPTRRALDSMINTQQANAPTERDRRDRRKSAKAQQMADEQYEREARCQALAEKTKNTAHRKPQGKKVTQVTTVDPEGNRNVYTTRDVGLTQTPINRPAASALQPRYTKVPPPPVPRTPAQLSGWAHNALSSSDFSEGARRSNATPNGAQDHSAQQPPAHHKATISARKLSASHATELIKLRAASRCSPTPSHDEDYIDEDIPIGGDDDDNAEDDDQLMDDGDQLDDREHLDDKGQPYDGDQLYDEDDLYHEDQLYNDTRAAKRERSQSDVGDSGEGRYKCERSGSPPEYHLARKIHASKGRAAAKDYERPVRRILDVAIDVFCSRIISEGLYADRMAQLEWTKDTWLLSSLRGTRTEVSFTEEEYKEVYEKHLANLLKFDEHTRAHGVLPATLQRLHDNGRIHAKVDPIKVDAHCLLTEAFDDVVREFQSHNGKFSDGESGDDEGSDNE